MTVAAIGIEDHRSSPHGRRRARALKTALVEVPSARTLVDIFFATVARSPKAVALDDGRTRRTYAQLAEAARRLAGELNAKGIGRGDRVGIQVPSGTADLYIAVLATLVAGAAYVPVDDADPQQRVEHIWREADVCAVITDGLTVVGRRAASARSGRPTPSDDCWVIFTSGSTGVPKGVVVTHGSAAAFVDAEATLWSVRTDDRVLASLSVGFDASCEEMWLAWRNGAALVPCPRLLVQTGIDVGPWLLEHDITVISTVPTLAALWDDDVLVNVRLLIVGGEVCSSELAARLGGSREVWNTYGPTEATVVSTATRLVLGEPVTIGRPLPGWQVAVVDTEGIPVRVGEVGELVIAGVGLGRYLDPTHDARAYAALPALGWDRAYRSGDMVREGPYGLEFVGRRDDQVKIAGRRIELAEVEARLLAVPGVEYAAATVKYSAEANAILVGYVVGDADLDAVRAQVVEHLPDGVAPVVVRLDTIPRKSSGKVDRAALPWPMDVEATTKAGTSSGRTPAGRALNATERWLADEWELQLGTRPLVADSDFFELGGTSIAAAKLVSRVRARYPSTAVADVYNFRRLDEFAARLDEFVATATTAAPVPITRHRWGALQLAGVLCLLGLGSAQWVVGLLAYDQWYRTGLRIGWAAVVIGWLVFSSAPGRSLIVVAARRTLLGRLRPGRYPRAGWLATRVWFVERLSDLFHLELLAGTPWAARFARINGVTVGPGVRLATLPSPTSLLRIDAGATLEGDVDARGWWIDGHELVVGEVHIGAEARIGTRCVLMPGADVGAGAEVEPGSVVTGAIGAGERWSGSPARCTGIAGEDWPDEPSVASEHRVANARYAAGLVAISLLPFLAAVPEFLVLRASGGLGDVHDLVRTTAIEAPLLAALFLVTYGALVAVAVRAVSRLIRPGWHRGNDATAWALWFTGAALDRARGILFPLYASVYTRFWLRLLGIRVGRRTEVSTGTGLNVLTRLGDTSFVADDVVFASTRARNGWFEVTAIEVGSHTFLGNGAILRAGTRLGDDCLVGVLSSPPVDSADGTSWFGLPPLELPRIADRPDPARTTTPTRGLVLARGSVEFFRILFPATASALLGSLVFMCLGGLGDRTGALGLLALAPFVLAGAGLIAAAITIAGKWVLIGRYRAGEHPLWSSYVWRDELVNSLQEQLAGAWLLVSALGSPVLPAYLRAMGSRVGRGVWFETLAVTEFDLVDLGAGASVNRGACIETHLFHDRLLRMGPVVLGRGSTLGPNSAVLPDSILGAGSTVGARSVVLRGEQVPPNSRWNGAPLESE